MERVEGFWFHAKRRQIYMTGGLGFEVFIRSGFMQMKFHCYAIL